MARANRQGNFIWEAVRQVIMVDPKWRDGAYPNEDPPRAGIGAGLQIQSVVGSSAAGFEESFATLLNRIAEGRPGIRGPRIPKGWSRSDYCPG
jgi:homoserine acetyltransferase